MRFYLELNYFDNILNGIFDDSYICFCHLLTCSLCILCVFIIVVARSHLLILSRGHFVVYHHSLRKSSHTSSLANFLVISQRGMFICSFALRYLLISLCNVTC